MCEAYVWSYKHPDEARAIYQRWEEGNLSFSMEVLFEEAECSVCGERFASANDYCEHLDERFSAGSETDRILRGLNFIGSGVVGKPADVRALPLALASDSSYTEAFAKMMEYLNIPLSEVVKFYKGRS